MLSAVAPLVLVLSSLCSVAHAALPGVPFQYGGIKWIEEGLSVLVKIETPGLPLLIWDKQSENYVQNDNASALLFNFTMSADNHTLYLFDEPILPIANFHVPPELWALRVPNSLSDHDLALLEDHNANGPNPRPPSLETFQPVRLDYDRLVTPRDDPSITYYQPGFVLRLNILGASNILLDVPTQHIIELRTEDIHHTQSTNPARAYNIVAAYTKPREDGTAPYVHPRPHPENACGWWMWRCADFDDPPWYRVVWRQEFDEYGRVGSLRRVLVRWLDAPPRVGGVSWVVLVLWAVGAAGVVVLGLQVGRLVRLLGVRPKRREGEAAMHLLADLDGVDYEDAALGPREGEYLLPEREPGVRERGEAYDVASKPLPPTPEEDKLVDEQVAQSSGEGVKAVDESCERNEK